MPWFSLVVPPPKLKITCANGQRAVNKSHVCARDRMHALPRKHNGEERKPLVTPVGNPFMGNGTRILLGENPSVR